MCLMQSTPNMPEPPAESPRLADEGVRMKRNDERRRQRMLSGRASTILTGGSGLSTPPSTASKTLLGG